jgi:lipopolysaccharide export system permease protein
VPKTQDIAKSFIRDSNIDYFPSLIKSQHFNDTASDLTIFIENKNNKGIIKNIFIKDNSSQNAQIISARRGMIVKKK